MPLKVWFNFQVVLCGARNWTLIPMGHFKLRTLHDSLLQPSLEVRWQFFGNTRLPAIKRCHTLLFRYTEGGLLKWKNHRRIGYSWTPMDIFQIRLPYTQANTLPSPPAHSAFATRGLPLAEPGSCPLPALLNCLNMRGFAENKRVSETSYPNVSVFRI